MRIIIKRYNIKNLLKKGLIVRYWLIFLSLFVCSFAEIQRAKISQTYAYEASPQDFSQQKQNNEVFIQILSSPLLEFMESNHPQAKIDTQSVRLNGTFTEFQTSNKNLRTYSNSSNNSYHFKFNFGDIVFELEKIDEKTYRLKHATELINTTQCKFILQKDLTSIVDGSKDFVINLDNQYYFSKVLATHRYIQCKK